MAKKNINREINYSRYEDNRDQNKRRNTKRPQNRNQMRRTNTSTESYSRDRRKNREYDFSNDERYDYIRKPRNERRNSRDDIRNSRIERERYHYSEPKQRVRQREQSFQGNRKVDMVQKNSGTLIFSFLWTLLFYTFTIGIIMTAVMFSFGSQSNASIFGYRFYTVLTNSMVPQKDGPKGGFYAGDVVIMKMMDGDKAQKGDIVTFPVGDTGQRYLTHRVVNKLSELNGEPGDYVVTKGDANESNDPPLEAKKIIGKIIFSVPKMGLVLDFIREEFWACLVSVLSLYGFFLVLKAYLFPRE